MKIRVGFVSNSSSSSFIVNKKGLTDLQIEYVLNPVKALQQLKKIFKEDYDESENFNEESFKDWSRCRFGDFADISYWKITEYENKITGYTDMDNFMYEEFLDVLSIPNITKGD